MDNYDGIIQDNTLPKSQDNCSTNFNKSMWIEQKQKMRDDAYALIDKTAKELIADMGLFKSYLNVQSKFDRYSVGNALLVAAQKPDAVKLADVKSWKDNNIYIKKGEKGLIILEPGDQFKREDGSVGVSYNAKKMFDVTQTTAKETPISFVKKDTRILIKALLNNCPVPVNISDDLPNDTGAIYKHETKEIHIKSGMNGDDIFRSLSSQIAYAMMDNGNYTNPNNSFAAYCVSYIVCKRNGIDVSNYSFEQLPSHYQEMSTKDIRVELAKIRDCANELTTNMARVLEPAKQSETRTISSR
ncbi:hypothetical protein RBG61_13000 [Paludicola sp. MB14-C6]|uniref:hypothetical protein n=1 Tax=Paludihabitans sp. MB14-C6 TaxID=3070656 RepID=UPI0027DD4F2C|nr:hypothetical protein [Paludicola sp. MB14-C6]WMJ22892.1 hypothetical protein RBG61_13000 [Paludicola sp. MB14-C6]